MLAQLTNVSLSFPDKKVFRILTGRLKPDAGTVSRAGDVRIRHLEQDFFEPEDGRYRTCMEAALEPSAGVIRFEKRLEVLAARLSLEEVLASVLMEELGEVQQRFEVSGGYSFRARTEATLTGLGLPEALWDREPSGLSAGRRVRLALAKVLLEEHDPSLFDEPTNYLDIETEDVLLGALEGFPGGVLFVSHDRRFMDALATKTLRLGIT